LSIFQHLLSWMIRGMTFSSRFELTDFIESNDKTETLKEEICDMLA
jgi:hypothetical protein